MNDEDFEPRLGKMRGRGRGKRYLSLVVTAARRAGKRTGIRTRRFDGSRIGRGAALARVLRSGDRHAGFRSRRVVVKTRLAMLGGKGLGAAQAHLKYIQRDGVTREGDPGELYSADRDSADGKAFLERGAGDRHQFRFIVSPEDADQYADLKPFVRRLMGQMEEDLGTRLDWVAVDHFNTGHPHTHIMLRGMDHRGENLVIAREYISHGLREQASRIVTLDLGPRTDLEIEERLRSDTSAERLTAIDRRLIRDMDEARLVSASDADSFQQALRSARLQKLRAMELAEPVAGTSWRLAEDLEQTLRRMGERGDIIRTMQRELSARRLERAAADQIIFDPSADGVAPLVGRVVARGLADELQDRHFLIVDGVDGRTYYAAIGRGEAIEPTPAGSIVRIVPREGGVRPVDRTVVEIAAANGGHYTIDAHLKHDPTATEAFAETHVRRLEAMRRTMRSIEREPDGSWVIAADHLDKAAAFEARLALDRPVTVESLSALPIERLPNVDAATWLDRELVSDRPTPIRDAGFGQEVRTAQALRRQWLVEQELAEVKGGQTIYPAGMIATLQRRELLRLSAQLSEEIDLPFGETRAGDHIEGRLVRSVEMASGKYAVIERSRDFTLAPWRPVLEQQLGKPVAGIVRDAGISWTFGGERGGPTIS
ncbi:relaxase/mobilization nuclease RlxS [Sphingomonas sp.]|uniref:relaxase/mobilization nuclease RlxS n=1 Tax=Sphingomonas sp. TaxID=28214 RepID=UPI0025E2CB1F|nr:relaxase/mobilization nuclease RlxS [Sphingomonas sp.]MBV9527328.1 relaxase/mobilization nuclease and DUF3363 domain-containing protein [Sphingomonas sp.]